MRKRRLFIVTILLFIFPCTIESQEIKPGVHINKENYKTYSQELKKLLNPGAIDIITNAIKKGWISIPVIKKGNYSPPEGFAEFTKKNKGKFKVGKDNRLIGPDWKGGLPFPEPETGAELGWNVYRRRGTLEEFIMDSDFFLIDKGGKLERTFKWIAWKKSWLGRTDLHPIPELEGNNGTIYWKESVLINAPFDVKGFSMIRTHYEDIYREDDVFSYIPALRRIRRLTGSDVTDPMLGSDFCYDDFEGWHQKLGPKMTFKLAGSGKFLVSTRFDSKSIPDFVKGNCFQVEWEIRDLWILEIFMNDPGYAYSKRVYYVEKEDKTATIYSAEFYDLKGRLWRIQPMIVKYFNSKTGQRYWLGGNYKDNLSGHSTIVPMYPRIGERVPLEAFTVRGLLRIAR
ncbi:MAG: DUF1329 domain-containing protein [Thermodesulfobacteriota bacterium]|nr:DUF1329 domain-containing protein [Thermodesulfobacteriota bacterium]